MITVPRLPEKGAKVAEVFDLEGGYREKAQGDGDAIRGLHYGEGAHQR
jgi:hypothetical protein